VISLLSLAFSRHYEKFSIDFFDQRATPLYLNYVVQGSYAPVSRDERSLSVHLFFTCMRPCYMLRSNQCHFMSYSIKLLFDIDLSEADRTDYMNHEFNSEMRVRVMISLSPCCTRYFWTITACFVVRLVSPQGSSYVIAIDNQCNGYQNIAPLENILL